MKNARFASKQAKEEGCSLALICLLCLLHVPRSAFSFQFSKRNKKKRITHVYPSERELILQFCRPSYFFAVHNHIKFCFYLGCHYELDNHTSLDRAAWKFSIRRRFREKSMKTRLKCTPARSKYHSNGSNNASEIDQNGPFHLKYFHHHKTIISLLLWKLELHRAWEGITGHCVAKIEPKANLVMATKSSRARWKFNSLG